ncbi:MAG TPA: hypothetical protein VGP79_08650 [Bryobacteraceae bacterium]|jgi:hypothetical protein|nr:hypothetical protein [Bryobacteraceae bacterium]
MKLLDYHRLYDEEKKSWDLAGIESIAARDDAAFPAKVRELLPREDQRFDGDLQDVKTGELFDRLSRLCGVYRDGTAAQQVYIRSRMTQRTGRRMESFGLRAAVLGAREASVEQVRLGLTGFAVADLAGGDVRETLMSLAVMFDCARKAGGDPAEEFSAVASLCGPAMAAVFTDFASRPPDLQSLRCMGWHEVQTPQGIGYRHGPPR